MEEFDIIERVSKAMLSFMLDFRKALEQISDETCSIVAFRNNKLDSVHGIQAYWNCNTDTLRQVLSIFDLDEEIPISQYKFLILWERNGILVAGMGLDEYKFSQFAAKLPSAHLIEAEITLF